MGLALPWEHFSIEFKRLIGLNKFFAKDLTFLRGGDVAGKHTIGFYLEGEYIELSHTATNRSIFAKGALEVALWLKDKAAKKYEISEMFG